MYKEVKIEENMKTEKKEIIQYLEKEKYRYRMENDSITYIQSYSQLQDVVPETLVWIKDIQKVSDELIEKLNHNLVVTIPLSLHIKEKIIAKECDIIECEYPKAIFFDVVEHFFCKPHKRSIGKTSVVETTKVGKNVSIGCFCHICEETEIGNDVTIYDHVAINCPTKIGDRTTIYSGVVIGSDGFGYYTGQDGYQHQAPHTGGVVIGQDVSIGANTCIDRGTIGNTEIMNHVKIDNLCHIAHNVCIKTGAVVIAQSMIGGSAVVEENAYVAPCAAIMNQVNIGENALIGMGAVVTKSVARDRVVVGVPAKEIRNR